ncbi:hypothetical protein LCGC14_0711010 [marine sediment metagenome]|uniref:Uncharacterized protein n=1 Tax=marine sediment metagenome TaxID=412755 RepID=A0A0F9QJI0_9ZZZZ
MSWIFTPIAIPNTTTPTTPTRVTLKGTIGQVGGLVLILPATTMPGEVGIRILTPEGALIPVAIEGSGSWIYSQKSSLKLDLYERRSVGKAAPINIFIEGFNTDTGLHIAHVGIFFHPWATDTERVIARIITTLNAVSDRTAWPEIERQVRRVFELARDFFTGGKND